MERRPLKLELWWRRRRRRQPPDGTPDRLQAWALIHLGSAIRAYQEGDTLRAIRHLSQAAENIAALIEHWTGNRQEET